MPTSTFSGESVITAVPQGPKPLHFKSPTVSDWSMLETVVGGSFTGSVHQKFSLTKSVHAPQTFKPPVFKFGSVKDGDSPQRRDWQNVCRIAPTALLLTHWTAVSAACLGFYFVVRKFLTMHLTLDFDDLDEDLNALIAGCVYCACMAALLLGVLVLACRRQQPQMLTRLLQACFCLIIELFFFMGFILSCLATNPLIPFDCTLLNKEACMSPPVAQALWSKIKLVVWIVCTRLA
ncbi:hypothetical protein FB451DRAFT_1257891 [Mycena latifolia]|nr:hypothetical protein FB451DRAFT_1257891 [Mycena latifolia]